MNETKLSMHRDWHSDGKMTSDVDDDDDVIEGEPIYLIKLVGCIQTDIQL